MLRVFMSLWRILLSFSQERKTKRQAAKRHFEYRGHSLDFLNLILRVTYAERLEVRLKIAISYWSEYQAKL